MSWRGWSWMVVPHEDACIIVDILEFDGITIKCHFVTAGVIIEPKVVEAVTRSLSFVGGVTYIKHDSWFLAEELFKDSGHHFKNLWVVGAMFMLSVIDEKVIGTIIHEDSVFVETDGVVYLLVGHEAESEVAQLLQNVGRTLVEYTGRKRHRAICASCSRTCSRHLSRASIICWKASA